MSSLQNVSNCNSPNGDHESFTRAGTRDGEAVRQRIPKPAYVDEEPENHLGFYKLHEERSI